MTADRARNRAIAAAACLFAAIATVVVLAGQAGADARQHRVHGHVEDTVVTDGSCTSSSGLCTVGTFTGGVNGDLAFGIDTLAPTDRPGVLLFTGASTISTARGDIHCADSGSFNSSGTSEGEGVHLCEITGGTGELAGAGGYLQETFHFTGTSGAGTYTGVIVLP